MIDTDILLQVEIENTIKAAFNDCFHAFVRSIKGSKLGRSQVAAAVVNSLINDIHEAMERLAQSCLDSISRAIEEAEPVEMD